MNKWLTYGPHKAIGLWKVKANMWQIVGGRRCQEGQGTD